MTDDRFTRNVMGSNDRDQKNRFEAATVTLPPEPGTEVAGPAMFDLVREIKHAQMVGQQLLKQADSLLDTRTIVQTANGTTTAAGLLDLLLYTVPGGFEFVVTRVNVEAVGFTPAVPYTNAAGWIALCRGDSFAVGSMLDFLPNPPLASGPILPAVMSDGGEQAGAIRGGEKVSLHIQSGPATVDIYVRLQGIQKAV